MALHAFAWTRDGRVRVEVVDVAAQVSGQIVQLPVLDNQFVHKGDVLFVIDPASYKLALSQAAALAQTRQLSLDIAKEDFERRKKIGLGAVSSEEIHTFQSQEAQALANYEETAAERDNAQLNLSRTTITSPVNGYVTNLHLRIGDYATPGQIKLSVVDSDSFWVAGYFEETKLPRIHPGDSASIRLMGVGPEIVGHVENFSRGIADTNAGADAPGLPSVDPIFTWVRLAQRIPVRITIDHVPDGIAIAAGQTCTVVIGPPRRR